MTPVQVSDPPVLDLKAFERTASFLPRDAIAMYLRTLTERGEALLRSLDNPEVVSGNENELVSAAHTLAGSAGLLGFARLAWVGRRYEQATLAGAADAQDIGHELETTIKATLDEIQHLAAPVPAPVQPAG